MMGQVARHAATHETAFDRSPANRAVQDERAGGGTLDPDVGLTGRRIASTAAR